MAAAPQASSRLEMLQARFQQRQLAEKEQKLLQLYDQQQLRAHQVAQRGSAGSNGSNSSGHGNASHHQTVTRTTTTTHATTNTQAGGGGKVRQMFDERRQTTVKGIDKSYPLEPLENRSRKHQTTSNVSVNCTSQVKNGNPTSNRRSVVTRRTVRSEANSNVNNGKPVVTYHEEVSREISDSNDRDNEQEEFGDDESHGARYENGNRRVDRPNQLEIEDISNENSTQRHRTTAKIHLAEFDRSTDLETELFPNDEITEVPPERLPGRSPAGKKSFQPETRLERPKNSNAKKIGQPINKQQVVAGNTTSFTKKLRNDNGAPSGSTSRASTVTMGMEGENSRGSSASPELGGSKKSRYSSPEVSETKGSNPPGCSSPLTKTSGLTKVSQLSHKNSTDFYPRRKSEFEKSKTFRKLQLELGESSPEPEDFSPLGSQCRKRSSILNDKIFSPGRRSSSSSPVHDKVYSKERKLSHETSPERPQSRRGSQSSSYRRESLTNILDRKSNREEFKTSSFETKTYSRRRSSSSSPIIDQAFPKGRKECPEKSSKARGSEERSASPTSRRWNEASKTFDSSTYSSKHRSTSWNPIEHRDYSNERKPSQERAGRSQSPIYSRKSSTTKEESRKSSFDSSTNNTRRLSSSSRLLDQELSKDRKRSHEQAPERPESRGGFSTPNYRRDSLTSRDERKTKSNYESSTFSSRLRSGSPILVVDYDLSEERSSVHQVPADRPASRERSSSPTPRRGSLREDDEKTSGRDTKHFASSTYSSRQHSASPVPSGERNYSENIKTSHEISEERARSREGSQSPDYRRESMVEQERRSTGKETLNFASYASRQRASYPTPPADGKQQAEDRKTSHAMSHERPGRPRERSQSPEYRRESNVQQDERSFGKETSFASTTFSSRQHAAYPGSSAEEEYPQERRSSHAVSHEGPDSRERSQSPTYRRESIVEHDRRSIDRDASFASTTFSSRQHAAYPTESSVDDDYPQDRITSHTISHDRPASRDRSQSPTYPRESFLEHDRRSIDRDTSFASTTFSSRQHAAYSSPEDDYPEDRRTSHTISHEGPAPRERSQSPIYHRRGSLSEHDEKSTGKETSTLTSSTFSSRQHSDSPIVSNDRNFSEDRKTSYTISHEGPGSRERSQSPIHRRRGSLSEHDEKSTGKETSTLTSSTFSSRQHSDSPIVSNDRNYSEDRKTSHVISHEGPGSRERSQSPTFRRGSYRDDTKTGPATSCESKTSSYETSAFSSRYHSEIAARDRDVPNEGRTSRGRSPEYAEVRGGSQSRTERRDSMTRSEDKKASTFASSTFSSRRRRSSSSGPVVDYEIPKQQEPSDVCSESIPKNVRKSGGNLRSFELIKKLVRPPSPGKKASPTSRKKSTDHKITLEDVELSTKNPNLRDTTKRPQNPEHKIVKKDKAPTKITKQDKTVKTKVTRNSRESRSRTISPGPVVTATEATSSLRTRKNEGKTGDDEKMETKNWSNGKEGKKNNSEIGRARDGKDRRKSSSEMTVKRGENFKVGRANESAGKIEKEKSGVKKHGDESKDKSQLLERIEKIRSTLSRSGRSEQNLRSNEFERTDSVESALRRFDSIGVESEHHVTVGVDEPDRISPTAKSEIYFPRNETKIPVEEEIIVKKTISPLCRPAKTAVAVVKARPRKEDAESPMIAKETEQTKKSSRVREKSGTTTASTPRNGDKKMLGSKSLEQAQQKRVTSMVKKSRLRSEERSGRGEGRAMLDDGSPFCKRKLFEDSESEIEQDNVRSTIVLTATTRVTNNSPVMMEIERKNNRESMRKSAENVLQMESSFRESKMENEPAKILRSIEDIRKSIKRESQDFKRELNKFNTAMRRNSSTRETPRSILTSGTVSCVQITKTFKSGDREPVVKIEKSVVKLPITHRIAKTPSPDIGTKRSVEGRTRTATNNVLRRTVPTSPAKAPDSSNTRCVSSEVRVSGAAKSSMRTSSSPGARETRNQKEFSITTEYADVIDGPSDEGEIVETEMIETGRTKTRNNAFVVDFNEAESSESAANREDVLVGKRSSERSLTSQRQSGSPTIAPSSRPASALSTTSSATSARGQISQQINSKSKIMSTKAKSPSSSGPRGNSNPKPVPQATDANDGLVSCKICSRRFNSDRVARHEQICSKTATKKRKQFDATIHRVKGTELESFVKKAGSRKSQADRKTQKPEVKSNWRRKHEDFINAIRSAKQVQAHLAAGGKLSDLPPPPASDTSDYVQCPHCGRKFNQGAADRHIPKCQTMMHNKPNSRAPPKPKR